MAILTYKRVVIRDEGILVARTQEQNFTGLGVTATAVGNGVEVNVPGGGGPGSVGPMGPPGIPGEEGGEGWPGIPGRMGIDGAPGAQGPMGQGTPGVDGEDGIDGFPGPQGPAGTAGAPGAAGALGPQGMRGFDGEDGEESNPGPPGPNGANGATGAVGPQGPQGLGAPGLDGDDGEPGQPGPPGITYTFVYTTIILGDSSDPLTTGTDKNPIPMEAPASLTIVEVRLKVKTAPTGAAIIVDVNKNGVTIFTTQTNRPQIAISATEGQSTTIEVSGLVKGDDLTFDIDQVGSTIAGSKLMVEVICRQNLQ